MCYYKIKVGNFSFCAKEGELSKIKKTKNYLIELLLFFFVLANLTVYSSAYGFYGVNNLSITRIMPAQRNLADQRLKSAGINWAREEFNWSLIQPRRNRWSWANPDQAMATHRRNGVQVVGMLAYSASWASTNPGAGANAIFYKPNINDWKTYVTAVARRYGDIQNWEIWNEPNFFWKPSPNPDEYREVLVAAYDAIKAVNPNMKVASGGTTYIDNDFIDRFLDNGGWEHLDAVSVHYYPGVGPESDPNNRLRDELLKLEYNTIVPHGGPKEIWITEMGWQSNQIGLEAQANVLSRALIIARTVNEAPKILIYNLRDDPTGSYGLVYNNFQAKPAYNYYKKTIEFLGSRWPALNLELVDGSKFSVFDGPGGPMAAAWNPDRTSEIFFHINSSSIRCYDIANQNNVEVTGNVVRSWNNGDIVLRFTPRPIFCALSNFSALNTNPSNKLPQVAGVSSQKTALDEENSPSRISGLLKNQFSRQIASSKVAVYRKTNSDWLLFSELPSANGFFDFLLPEGDYYLVFQNRDYLSSRSRPFKIVEGVSDVNVKAVLFNRWISYGLLLGGMIVLILFILKYSRRKTKGY